MHAALPRHVRAAAAAVLAVSIAGCATLDATPTPAGDCEPPLPPVTSPDELPEAMLRINGEDLPPVRGDIRWTGDGSTAVHEGPERVHVQRFIVTVAGAVDQASIRLSDGVAVEGWEVWAVPAIPFRRGNLESERTVWAARATDESGNLLCVDVDAGDWLVGADLTFANGGGEGTYYWRIIVNR